MIPVDQTKFGKGGNCMSACIASILEMDLNEVPNFFEITDTDIEWWTAVRTFLRERGWGLLSIGVTEDMLKGYEGIFIVGGASPRFPGSKVQHAVIWQNGKLTHDPHPDRLGVEVESIDMLYPLDPAKFNHETY